MMNRKKKKEKSPARARQDGGGEAISCIYFLCNEEKQSSSGKNWASMLMASAAALFSSVVFQRHWSSRQLCVSRFQLEESWWDEPQLTGNAAAWSLATDHDFLWLCCCFVVMKTAPENAVPWCRLLTPASVTRRKTSPEWSKHARHHFVQPASAWSWKSAADRPSGQTAVTLEPSRLSDHKHTTGY